MAPARAYQVDELLKLRRNIRDSESDVVRRINSEAGIKEHVLRSSSNGSDPTGFRTKNRSSSIVTNPYDGYEIPPNDDFVMRGKLSVRSQRPSKHSPTPSIKRGKVERLLKEHGSPPGIRVTAGGRIVPESISPLTSPRFDQARQSKFQRFPQVTDIPPIDRSLVGVDGKVHGYEGFLVAAPDGTICQIVRGQLVSIGHMNGGHLDLQLPPTNPMLTTDQFGVPHGAMPVQTFTQPFQQPYGPPQPHHFGSPASTTAVPAPSAVGSSPQAETCLVPETNLPPVPISERTLAIFEDAYRRYQAELKELDRNEVLQRDALNDAARRNIVSRRIELVERIDESRKGANKLRSALANNESKPADSSQTAKVEHSRPKPITIDDSPSRGQFMPFSAGFPPLNPFNFASGLGYPFPPAQVGNQGFQQYVASPSASQQMFSLALSSSDQTGHLNQPFIPYQPMQDLSGASGLQIRAGNAGIGARNLADDAHDNIHAAKHSAGANGNTGINLDGTGHQPRRSHAVQIKKPEEQLTDRRSLDPTSPSYEPSKQKTGEHEASPTIPADENNFMPSPDMVAGVDNLVKSPERSTQDLHETEENGSARHASGSSANTADFFPYDSHRHSSTNYGVVSRSSSINLDAWMTQGCDRPTDLRNTPVRAKSEFVFNDSPEEQSIHPIYDENKHFGPLLNHDGRLFEHSSDAAASPGHGGPGFGKGFVLKVPPRGGSLASSHSNLNHSREATAIGNNSSFKCVESGRQSPVFGLDSSATSPVRDFFHRMGLEDGINGKLPSVPTSVPAKDSDRYLHGYLEGVTRFKENLAQEPAQARELEKSRENLSNQSQQSQNPPVGRAHSMPSFEMAGGPNNSPARSMRRIGHNGTPPTTTQSFDKGKFSPAAELAFSSQPNLKVKDIPRTIGTQAPSTRTGNAEPTSPLASRRSANQGRELVYADKEVQGPSFKERMRGINNLEEQRFQARGKASTAISHEQASSRVTQYDGSGADNEMKTKQCHAVTTPPSSPNFRVVGKNPPVAMGSLSPTRRVASYLSNLSTGRKEKAQSSIEGSIDAGQPLNVHQTSPARCTPSSPGRAPWMKAPWRNRK